MKNYSEDPLHYKQLIAQINEEVNFSGYLISQGYQLSKKSTGSQEFRKDDKRIVLQVKRQPVTYFNRNNSSDKGRFFKFIHTRSLNFYEAIKSGLDAIERTYPTVNTPTPQKSTKNFISLEERYNIQPLTKSVYLTEERHVSQLTLQSEAFKDRIFNAFHVNDNQGRIANIALPKYATDGGIKNYTLYNRPYRDRKDGKMKKFRLFLNERYEYLFVSNPEVEAEKVVCVESGFDAMAYHELHGHPNAFYISMSGHIDSRKLEQFFQWNKVVSGPTPLPIHLALDHDIEGMRYDLMVLSSYVNRRSDSVFMELDWKRPIMQLKLNYQSKSLIAMERDADFINRQIGSGPEGMTQVFDKVICFKDKVIWELNLEQIHQLQEASRTFWQRGMDILSQCFLKDVLKIDKSPTHKDWNDELISVKKKSDCRLVQPW
ncbi:toprim domain-containing protein [Maribacter sp. ACAM166]|uniref:toprim domain-containing protein n=1 Tax=Maribacter sp. ACAM166 TaxID=2508996 RepID=UPI0010FD6DD7|nr:toprim domain-containing protein [Maribacter sp. ACAM166]TLP81829.1 toprim domain-containing protein [Maribacter sp. ACAM166]